MRPEARKRTERPRDEQGSDKRRLAAKAVSYWTVPQCANHESDQARRHQKAGLAPAEVPFISGKVNDVRWNEVVVSIENCRAGDDSDDAEVVRVHRGCADLTTDISYRNHAFPLLFLNSREGASRAYNSDLWRCPKSGHLCMIFS